jgi:uncharacterized membrane protein YqaE (UPF0057 family)
VRYFLAIILPPLAVLLCGKPFSAMLNFVLCLFFFIPGIIHALLVVADKRADERAERCTLRL